MVVLYTEALLSGAVDLRLNRTVGLRSLVPRICHSVAVVVLTKQVLRSARSACDWWHRACSSTNT